MSKPLLFGRLLILCISYNMPPYIQPDQNSCFFTFPISGLGLVALSTTMCSDNDTIYKGENTCCLLHPMFYTPLACIDQWLVTA